MFSRSIYRSSVVIIALALSGLMSINQLKRQDIFDGEHARPLRFEAVSPDAPVEHRLNLNLSLRQNKNPEASFPGEGYISTG